MARFRIRQPLNVLGIDPGVGDHGAADGNELAPPSVLRVVLDPARAGHGEGVFDAVFGHDGAAVSCDQDTLRGVGANVHAEQIGCIHRP